MKARGLSAREAWRLVRSASSIVSADGRREVRTLFALQAVGGLITGAIVLTVTQLQGGTGTVLASAGLIGAGLAGQVYISAKQRTLAILLAEKVGLSVTMRLMGAAADAPLVRFDDAAFHLALLRSRNMGGRPLELVQGTMAMLRGAVSVIAVSVAVVIVNPLLLPAVLLAAIPLMVAAGGQGAGAYVALHGLSENLMRQNHVEDLLTRKEVAADVRAYELRDFLLGRISAAYRERFEVLRDFGDRTVARALVSGLAAGALTATSVVLIAVMITNGQLSPLDALAGAIALLQVSVALQAVAASLDGLVETMFHFRDFDAFVDEGRHAIRATSATDGLSASCSVASIELSGVTFSYPGSRHDALSDVSLLLQRGQLTVLVGANGSGKSTLGKIAAGLYPPDSGVVSAGLTDGGWTGELAALRSRIAYLPQDCAKFYLELGEAVSIGRADAPRTEAEVLNALHKGGASAVYSELGSDLCRQLGSLFPGGADLSEGQWQRVALSRFMFRGGDFLILDEPTASLDARSEAAFAGRLLDCLPVTGALVITHSAGVAELADQIVVMHGGQVVESGTHAQLTANGGHFAELFAESLSTET